MSMDEKVDAVLSQQKQAKSFKSTDEALDKLSSSLAEHQLKKTMDDNGVTQQ